MSRTDDPADVAAETDLIRRRVINVVGHELRTPITTIRGLAEQIERADASELRESIVPALIRNATRVESLLDDMLIATGVSTATPVTVERVDLHEIARAVWRELHGDPRDLTGGPAIVEIDPRLAHRMIEHVCRNALQYATGGVEIETGTTFVEVRNESGEIDAHDLDLAFQLFFRGEPAVMRAPGMGLGLPVARGLARSAGGDVTVRANGEWVVARIAFP